MKLSKKSWIVQRPIMAIPVDLKLARQAEMALIDAPARWSTGVHFSGAYTIREHQKILNIHSATFIMRLCSRN